MSDIKLARDFVKECGSVKYDFALRLTYYINQAFRVECFITEDGTISHIVPDLIAIAILERWLRDQLRDGGNSDLWVKELSDEVIEVQSLPRDDFTPSVCAVGTSDLDALIKTWKEFKGKQ